MSPDPATKPSDIDAQDGDVRVDGPDGIKYSFTPDAAIETSDRMLSGALKAQGQVVQKELARSLKERRKSGGSN